MKTKVVNLIKRFFVMIVIIVGLLLAFGFESIDNSQIMEKLNYEITLNQDGSMSVIETWDIYIDHTNTLFRTFNKSNKFGNIVDVNVKDLETGRNLTKIYKEMYHVTTNCFYALDISSNQFEVAWGTGMEETKGKKKYQISYTITDVITQYNDCQEFYWKLLDSSNTIPVKEISGTIKLPQTLQDINKLKVWGHGAINGEIKKVSNHRIDFYVNDFRPNTMLELRVATEEKIFNVNIEKMQKFNQLSNIIKEETKWAEETNIKTYILYYILGAIYSIFIIMNIFIIVKYYKISRKKDDGIINKRLKYFREIPRENATPAEAVYIYSIKKNNDNILKNQSDIVSAIILDLVYKKIINLQIKDKKIYIKLLKEPNNLNEDELAIYKLLKLSNEKNEEYFEIGKLKDFAKKEYIKYNNLIQKMVNEARESIYRQKLVDKANKKSYSKCKNAKSIYQIVIWIIQFIIIAFFIGFIPWFEKIYISIFGIAYKSQFIIHTILILPMIITFIIQLKIKMLAQPKIAVLTQSGAEEKEKWKALKRYLEEYSLIKEKDIFSLEIWEKYLIYATAFGIADRVIEQMKSKYPEVFVKEYWKDEMLEQYEIFSFMARDTIYNNLNNSSNISVLNTSTKEAYKTSLSEIASHSSSSGSGSGGGFSSGRRRSEEAEAGMGRKIRICNVENC